jgi:hypothetical protein
VSIPIIEQAKIQAQVLVPLLRRPPTRLSARRSGRLIAATAKNFGGRGARRIWGTPSTFAQFARGDAIDYRVREQSHDAYDIDVTACRYAQFYHELGEPELGFLLICSADFWMAEGFGPDIKLTRTQTIMQAASHCDFRYRRQREQDPD